MNPAQAAGVNASPSPKIIAIRAFSNAGYTLIPLRGKIPAITDWVNTAPGQFGEKELAAGNYGVALRAGDLIVDIDPRNFAPGDQPIKRLVEAVGAPLDSFTVKTGGGGFHIYFKKSPDVLLSQGLRSFPGIEIKTAGRQVVGPGSIHPDTKLEYAISRGSVADIKDAPPGLIALFKKIAAPFAEASGAGTGEYKDDATTQGRYISYLTDVAAPSVEGRGGDHNAFKVACHGRDLGLSPAAAYELLLDFWNPRCAPPWDAEELKTKVIHAYTYAKGAVGTAHPAADFTGVPIPTIDAPPLKEKEEEISWVTTKQGAIVCPNFQNLVTYMRFPNAGLKGVFGYNEFTGRVEFTNPAPWHRGKLPSYACVGDNDLKLLKGHLAMRHGFEMPVSNIEEAVTIAAYANHFHPVREYLEGLQWDGKKRLDAWLTTFLGVEDTSYTRAVARKTLCAAVMRVFRPGCKFDHVLVFEGLQGIGKSSVVRILGGDWAADFVLDPHNKDSIQLMQGKWLIELAEMETTRRSDMSALKAFLSRSKDEARLAYGRTVGEFPRQSIFIGSINPGADGTYLSDDENRRWWPVHCSPPDGQVDFQALKKARNQLWAEAVALVKTKGEYLFMETAELKSAARAVVALRHAEHAWTERISQWLHELDMNEASRRDFLTARDVYVDAMGGIDKQLDRRAQLAIANVLYSLGWKRGHKRVTGRFTNGYVRGGEDRVLGAAAEKKILDILGDLA